MRDGTNATVQHTASTAEQHYKPTAFITMSLIFDGDQIERLFLQHGAEPGSWNADIFRALQEDYQDTHELRNAINPMFDDIADMDRNLFIKDFLIDASDPQDHRSGPRADRHDAAEHSNVSAKVSLSIDKATWQTEGHATTIKLRSRIEFSNVHCRAYWMAHSNCALSYHLSFEIAYEHCLEHYYGLSLLLKANFPTENTFWVTEIEKGGWKVSETIGNRTEDRSILAFVKHLFNNHARHLLDAICKSSRQRCGQPGFDQVIPISENVASAVVADVWASLVSKAHHPGTDPAASPPERPWGDPKQRRLLVLLRDAKMFETIRGVRSTPVAELNAIVPPELNRGSTRCFSIDGLEKHYEELARKILALRKEEATLKSIRDELRNLQLAVFASGFFQNVIDFLEQDGLEIHDGISPIYPSRESAESNEGFIIYATQQLLFEVVSSSRSLDDSGRTWIGTCPYLFLVHITAFNNERVVHQYEELVAELVRDLEGLGLDGRSTFRASEAYKRISEFRLRAFSSVHKHFSLNFFRYETERTVFEEVERVRGTRARQRYWEEVLEKLAETVSSLTENQFAQRSLVYTIVGAVFAITGLLQVWFILFPVTDGYHQMDKNTSVLVGLGGAFVLFVLLIGVLFKDPQSRLKKRRNRGR